MKTKFILLLAIAIIIFSCKKEEAEPETINNDPISQDIEDITASFDFDWSSSKSGVLNVNIQPESGGNISTEGQIILLIDENDNILSKAVINNSHANFVIKLPANIGDVYLMYPNSANIQKLEQLEGNIDMPIAPQPRNNIENNLKYDRNFAFNYQKNMNKFTNNDKAKSSNLVQNGEFDIDNLELDSRYWTSLRAPGKWYYTKHTEGHVTNISGENVFKNYSGSFEVIEQSFPVQGGSAFNFSMEFSGSIDLWLDNFNADGDWIGETYVTTSGNSIVSSGIILEDATHFQFYIGLQENSYVDKIEYTSVDVVTDTDNDGVNDNGDDYPNDPDKAYKIMYPNIGYNILCFEDLWPSKGDYDFNDLVLAMQGELSVNPDGYYVNALFRTKINASGGSVPLGFACNIVDADRNSISTDLIQSVTGNGYTDNDVNNGVVFFDDKFDIMVPYYTNTSYDYTGTPVEITTTINFNNNYKGTLMPNFYTFRTNERGYEVHLPNFNATEAASQSVFGTFNDNAGTPYRTENGLPWAMEITLDIDYNNADVSDFKHPLESVKITSAYSNFASWAISSGENETDWYLHPNQNTVFE